MKNFAVRVPARGGNIEIAKYPRSCRSKYPLSSFIAQKSPHNQYKIQIKIPAVGTMMIYAAFFLVQTSFIFGRDCRQSRPGRLDRIRCFDRDDNVHF